MRALLGLAVVGALAVGVAGYARAAEECEALGQQLDARSTAFEADAARFNTRVEELAAGVGENGASPDQVEELTTLVREACASVSRATLEMRRLYERMNTPQCLAADPDVAKLPATLERMREAVAGTCAQGAPKEPAPR